MAKVVMLVNSFFTGSKSGKKMQIEKGQLVEEEEVKHLIKGADYDTAANVEAAAPAKKK